MFFLQEICILLRQVQEPKRKYFPFDKLKAGWRLSTGRKPWLRFARECEGNDGSRVGGMVQRQCHLSRQGSPEQELLPSLQFPEGHRDDLRRCAWLQGAVC